MNLRLGERLRELRGNRTQVEIAKYLGVTRGTIARYENGNREPDQYTLKKLADFFNIDVDYLIGHCDIPSHCISEKDAEKYTVAPLKSNQVEDFIKQTEAFFANNNLSQTEKEYLFKNLMELLWEMSSKK